MDIELLTERARNILRDAILEASDNEVFFVGSFDEHKLISSVRVVARGNENSVPAIVDSAAPGDVVIHNHPSGNLKPSDQDIQMASLFGNQGIGFIIVNNTVDMLNIVVEPFFPEEITPLDVTDMKDLLLPEGAVARGMGEEYELREEQLDMVEAVTAAFNDNRISLIEAGTGTGKTLSYLIPSVHWALRNRERVVISTNTINLQEQLIDKDLPMLEKALDRDFSYSLVKGMGNYLCLLRAETVNEGLFEMAEDDEVDSINEIIEWIKITNDGSLSDLGFTPSESVWEKVSAESDSCLRARCPHYNRCFFFKARRELASSQILVVNHHLLFSDLSIKTATDKTDAGILPPFNRVIFDEAHNLSDAATSHFGMRAAKYGIIRVLRRLKRKGRKGESKGLIYFTTALAARLVARLEKGVLNDLLKRVDNALSPRVDMVEDLTSDAYDSLYAFVLEYSRERGETKDEVNLRITEQMFEREGWEDLDRKFSILKIRLKELHEEIKSFTDLILDYEDENDVSKLLVEFRGVSNKLDYYSDVISTFLGRDDDGFVRWFEGRQGRGGVLAGLGLSPLDISGPLKERLYSHCDTVIMTSATMAVAKSFKFLKTGLGLLDDPRVSELILESPFDYMEQMFMAIPRDLPPPVSRQFSENVHEVIRDAVIASRGNALILFTSYALLDKVYESIHRELESAGIITLKQGLLPRGRLLEQFRIEYNSALFATDSFWEGVDVPGDALRMVVITRLPFRVPTEPIIEARIEHMEAQGLNSFIDYSVPVAVIKFKQGFGRLIRTKSDTGAVLILDTRIINKFYGRYFLESLPECRILISDTGNTIANLKDFFI